MEPTRKDLENKLITRAWEDQTFKAELMNNPRDVIRRELEALGISLPENVSITVHEETPSQVHLVLPTNTAVAEAELSDADLDLVAGGDGTVDKHGNVGCS